MEPNVSTRIHTPAHACVHGKVPLYTRSGFSYKQASLLQNEAYAKWAELSPEKKQNGLAYTAFECLLNIWCMHYF